MGVKVDCSDVVDPYVMDADAEVELRIIDVSQANDKNGNPYIMPRFEVVGEIAAKEFSYYLGLTTEAMTPKQKNASASKYRAFCTAFEIDHSEEQEPEDWIGLEGVAIVGVSESDQYGEQNYVKRFVEAA